jgi:uncharacterized membrane protein
MIPLLVLLSALLIFRGIGSFGVGIFSTWQDSARFALAVMFFFTASAHFTKVKQDLINMVPRVFLFPGPIVFITGVFEIAGAVGILILPLKGLAGMCLIVLMAAMFPANINAAKNKVLLRGKPPTPLWLRLPIQIIFMGMTWWCTQS